MAHHNNTLTDITGVEVGSAHDATICTGVTVVLPPPGSIASVDVRGGGTGTLETEALGPDGTVEDIHALVVSGGSAFGLAASGGVRDWLADRGRGFQIGNARVPIVAQAILFDLLNGGDKSSLTGAYQRLAKQACDRADASPVALGSVGAGFGASTVSLRGGLGSASLDLGNGTTVAALVAANPVGSVTMGDTPHFWAHAFERSAEFGGLGGPPTWQSPPNPPRMKGNRPGANTTLAIVGTNACLTKAQARRLAIMAQTGLARAIHPVHTPLDGDVVFAFATNRQPLLDADYGLASLGSAAADCLARATARGIYEADPIPESWIGPPAYREVFPRP